MKRRPKFLRAALESLEERQLLTTNILSAFKHHTAQVLGIAHHKKAHLPTAVGPRNAPGTIVPGGPVGQAYTTPLTTGAATNKAAKLNVVIPFKGLYPTAPTLGPTTTTTPTTGVIPSATAGNRVLSTLSPTIANRLGSMPSVFATGGLISLGNGTAGTTTTTTTPAVATTTLPVVNFSATPATTGVSASSISAMPVAPSGAMPINPMPLSMFGIYGTSPLSASDVAAFKTSIDTFAANYTSGADTTKDAAAVTALNSAINDLSQSVMSETNVADKTAVANFQSAVNGFASSYTSGTNLAADKAAWASLATAVNNFGSSLKDPNATATTNASGGPQVPGGFQLASMLTSTPGIDVGSMIGSTPLSATEISTLKTAVDTFATTYTHGANATTDLSASDALQTSLSNLMSTHWQNSQPVMPINYAGAAGMPAPYTTTMPPASVFNAVQPTAAATTAAATTTKTV